VVGAPDVDVAIRSPPSAPDVAKPVSASTDSGCCNVSSVKSAALQSVRGEAHVADESGPETAALHAQTQLLCYNNITPTPHVRV
jgi:hypothetical protein